VFPAHDAAQAVDSLDSSMRKVVANLPDNVAANISYGLYFSDLASCQFVDSPQSFDDYAALLTELNLKVTTANAFPFGNFRAAEVKEKAFLPDWREQSRVDYTCRVADLLAHVATSDNGLSISTCPFGYDSAAACEQSIVNVRLVVAHLQQLHQRTGKHIRLAFEAEPCACFSDSVVLIDYLATNFSDDERKYVGICFDLCHSAVTDEDYQKVIAQAEQQNVAIAKVQISSALQRDSKLCGASTGDLEQLAGSAYFHQCLVDDTLYADISQVPKATVAAGDTWRIHCHVPICYSDYGSGWRATAWRPAVEAAIAAQIKDFEVETYTLSLLNTKFAKGESVEECVAREICAGFLALGLDTSGG
jgi:hypothetical protein